MQKIFDARCPCCNKELNIEIIESGGEMTATLSYPQRVASREELEARGYEFGEAKRKTIFNRKHKRARYDQKTIL